MFFSSKRQGAIETSTYGVELCAMRTAVEEVQSVRYMLHCLGVEVRYASFVEIIWALFRIQLLQKVY